MSERSHEKAQRLLAAIYSAIARKRVTPEEIAEIRAKLPPKPHGPRRRRPF